MEYAPEYRCPEASYTTVRLLEEVSHGSRCFDGVYRSTFLVEGFPYCKQLDHFSIVEPGKRALLIDTGHCDLCGRACIDGVVDALGVPWPNVDVFMTHYHEDHDGNLPYCIARGVHDVYSAEVDPTTPERKRRFYRRAAAQDLESPEIDSLLDMLMCAKRSVYASDEVRVSCSGGEVLPYGGYRFEVLPTPGHTLDHMCLLDREKGILFAGDFIVDAPPGVMQFDPDQHLLVRHIESLALVRTLKLEAVFMSHHDPLFGPDAIGEFIAMIQKRYDDMLAQTMDIVRQAGRVTAYQASYARAARHPGGFDAMPLYTKGRRLGFMFAALEGLYDRGEVMRLEGDDGEFVYRPRRRGLLVV